MSIYISYAISEFLYIYAISIFLSSYLGKSRFGKASLIFFGIFYILDGIIYFLPDEPVIYFTSSIILYYLLSVVYAKPSFKNITVTLIMSICTACSQFAFAGIISVSNRLIGSLDHTYAVNAALIGSRLVFYFSALIFKRIYKKKHFSESAALNPAILTTPVLSMLVLHLTSVFSETRNHTYTTVRGIPLIITAAFLITVNILVFYLCHKQRCILLLKKHNDILKNAITVQQHQYQSENQRRNSFHREKHDYKNFLIGIKSALEKGNIDSAISKINEHIGTLSMPPISNTGCYALDSIINYKGQLANSCGITIKTSCRIEAELDMSADDLCILFGVALDNAIEYLSEHKQVMQTIKVIVNYSRNMLLADISNHVCENIVIKDNSIPSSKNSFRHGFGLESARFIIKKYNGNLHLNCRDRIFHFGVSICIEA